ncbi:MAG: CRISPR-associated endoribonuclease Cas6 [Firmicutes bacterium]|nr:CRISPR-associated endoribonuclease Cas6 [Bacillota bacterium]
MHISIHFGTGDKPLDLPIHYNALVQGAIYANINPVLATLLHDHGFPFNGRTFKLFSYSKIIGKYTLIRERCRIVFPEGASLVVSTPVEEICRAMAGLILRDGFRIGSQELEVKSIDTEEHIVRSDTIELELLSPVVVYSTFAKPGGGKYTCYFQPGEKEFARLIYENLRKKYSACHNKTASEGEFMVRLLNRPRQNLVIYKNTIIKGYTCKLILSGPGELLQIALDAGLGSKNSQGFGCCRPS